MNSAVIDRLIRLFLRHESWVLRTARRYPMLSTFPVGTLFVWYMVPAIAVSPLVIFVLEGGAGNGFLVIFIYMFVGGVGTMCAFLWLYGWFLLCVALFLGDDAPAERKAEELENRLREVETRLRAR